MKKIIISLAICAIISTLNVEVFAGFAEVSTSANGQNGYTEQTQVVTVPGGVAVNYSLSVVAAARPFLVVGNDGSQAYAAVIAPGNVRFSIICSADDTNCSDSRSSSGVSDGCCNCDRDYTIYVEAMAERASSATAVASISWS